MESRILHLLYRNMYVRSVPLSTKPLKQKGVDADPQLNGFWKLQSIKLKQSCMTYRRINSIQGLGWFENVYQIQWNTEWVPYII